VIISTGVIFCLLGASSPLESSSWDKKTLPCWRVYYYCLFMRIFPPRPLMLRLILFFSGRLVSILSVCASPCCTSCSNRLEYCACCSFVLVFVAFLVWCANEPLFVFSGALCLSHCCQAFPMIPRGVSCSHMWMSHPSPILCVFWSRVALSFRPQSFVGVHTVPLPCVSCRLCIWVSVIFYCLIVSGSLSLYGPLSSFGQSPLSGKILWECLNPVYPRFPL